MKRFLRLIMVVTFSTSSTIGLIACTIPDIADVWIITDGGDLFDKAFNQQVLEGTQEFVGIFNNYRSAIASIKGFDYWKNREIKCHWIISRDNSISTLQNNYNLATFAGAKNIVVAGFHHLSALTPAIQNKYKNLGVRFILVDSKLNPPIDVAGLTYAAEQSGFLAGLAGALWLVANHEKYDSNGDLRMSAFGGLPADTIVSYMMGYYWGIYYYNTFRTSDSAILTMVNKMRAPNQQIMSLNNSSFNIRFDKIPNQFTGSFDAATNASKAITSQLIDGYKEDIVMPVAGAQTIDLVSAIVSSANNRSAKIVGVDVDQSVQYDYAKNMFVTSALKGIHKSVVNWLWHAFNLKISADATNPVFTSEDGGKYFNGFEPQAALGGQEYTGIAKNNDITEIYGNLITDSNKYWNLAQKVTAAFNKLSNDLAQSSDQDKWEKAWQTDVEANNDKYKPNFS